MPQEFKPSRKSSSPDNQEVLAKLNYLKKAVEALETCIGRSGALPDWVVERINKAVVETGMAVSFVQFAEKRFQETETTSPKQSKKVKTP